jgi:caa(3)-type oxidase subunit IV
MDREMRHILIIPLIVWAALIALLGLSLAYAYWPDAPGKFLAGLFIAGAKAAPIGAIFMQLRNASPLVQLASAAGLAWLSLLFLFSFADFLTR